MADDPSESKPFLMTPEFPRDSSTLLLQGATCLLAGTVSVRVVTIATEHVVLYKACCS